MNADRISLKYKLDLNLAKYQTRCVSAYQGQAGIHTEYMSMMREMEDCSSDFTKSQMGNKMISDLVFSYVSNLDVYQLTKVRLVDILSKYVWKLDRLHN